MRKWEYQDWAQILETVLGFSGAPTCGHICPPGLWEPHNAFLPHWQDFCATENHGLTVILRPTEWGKPTESSQCPGQTLEEPGPNLTHRHFAPCSAAFPFYLKYLPLKNLEISHKSSYSQLLWKLAKLGPYCHMAQMTRMELQFPHLTMMPTPVCQPLPVPCTQIFYPLAPAGI